MAHDSRYLIRAAKLEMPKSTVHDHRRTLTEAEYPVTEGGTYRVGAGFLALGDSPAVGRNCTGSPPLS
ncbi:hypothetical protein [Halopiger thermotolerans]